MLCARRSTLNVLALRLWLRVQLQEAAMSKYLVVAHQTATSPVLLDKLREIAAEDETATFTLLVPATPVQHLLTKREGEAIALAQHAASEARALAERNGIRVNDALVGDASPIEAIA